MTPKEEQANTMKTLKMIVLALEELIHRNDSHLHPVDIKGLALSYGKSIGVTSDSVDRVLSTSIHELFPEFFKR